MDVSGSVGVPGERRRQRRLRRWVSRTLRSAALAVGCSLAGGASAALLLTEIHYNGVASGTDPDEFLELSNAGAAVLQLDDYRFAAGIGFSFPEATRLAPGQSLVIARSSEDFRQVYSDFGAPLFDFSGALSNSGETLSLLDALGTELWSLSYDDRSPWPTSADGSGDSLQLVLDATSLADPASWRAATPTPGSWWPARDDPDPDTGSGGPATVANPAPLPLLLAGLGLLGAWRGRCAGSVKRGVGGALAEL